MTCRKSLVLAAAASAGLLVGSADAHPHVMIAVESQVAFDGRGAPQSLTFRWAYDPVYTAFALRELGLTATSPASDRPADRLARSQIEKLNAVSFFTKVSVDGRDVPLGGGSMTEATLRVDDGLTMSVAFDLTAASPGREIAIEILDPTFLAYFTVADPNGVTLASAPKGCVGTASGPQPLNLKNTASVPKAFWAALDGSATDSKYFASRVLVLCP